MAMQHSKGFKGPGCTQRRPSNKRDAYGNLGGEVPSKPKETGWTSRSSQENQSGMVIPCKHLGPLLSPIAHKDRESLAEEINGLKMDLHEARAGHRELLATVEKQREDIMQLKRQIANMQESATAAAALLAERDRHRDLLDVRLDELSEVAARGRSAAAEADSEAAAYAGQLARLHSLLKQLVEQRTNMRAGSALVDELKSEVRDVQKANRRLEDWVGTLQQNLHHAHQEAVQHKSEIRLLHAKGLAFERVTTERREALEAVASERRHRAEAEAMARTLRTEVEVARREAEEARVRSEDYDWRLREATSRAAEAAERARACEAILQSEAEKHRDLSVRAERDRHVTESSTSEREKVAEARIQKADETAELRVAMAEERGKWAVAAAEERARRAEERAHDTEARVRDAMARANTDSRALLDETSRLREQLEVMTTRDKDAQVALAGERARADAAEATVRDRNDAVCEEKKEGGLTLALAHILASLNPTVKRARDQLVAACQMACASDDGVAETHLAKIRDEASSLESAFRDAVHRCADVVTAEVSGCQQGVRRYDVLVAHSQLVASGDALRGMLAAIRYEASSNDASGRAAEAFKKAERSVHWEVEEAVARFRRTNCVSEAEAGSDTAIVADMTTETAEPDMVV